jgi:hypothetical protein
VVYANEHSSARKLGGSLYRFSLFESICLFYKTRLLACNRFQIWGGGDASLNKNKAENVRDIEEKWRQA